MARLVVIAGPDNVGKSYVIGERASIGSMASNTIFLNSSDIQPNHLHITVIEDNVYFKTVSSNIRVDINGEEIQEGSLTHGDLLTIGDYTLMLDEEKFVEKPPEHVQEAMQSRIESRVQYYDSTEDVLDNLKEDKTQGRLITLYKIANAISGILDLDHLLHKFLEIILEEFSSDRGFIILFDSARNRLIPAAAISKRKSPEKGHTRISRTIVDEVLTTKESILCENILDDTRFSSQDSLISHNIRSAMCVPLIRQGEILGLIHVDSQHSSKFSSSDLDLLTKVALHAAIVIENARFYKVRQEFSQNLLALSRATQSISSYLRDDLIIKDTAQYAARIFHAERSFLFLRKDNELELITSEGTPKNFKLDNIPEKLKHVAATHQNLFYQKKEEIPSELSQMIGRANSFIAVPLSTSDTNSTCMGILCIADKKEEEVFTIEDQQLLGILANYAAIALSNSKFYKELKRKEAEIAKWNLELEKRVTKRTEELKSAQGQLVQSEKMAAIGLLAAGVAHEFNNIIASMYGFAQIAKKNEQYQAKLVDIVVNQSQRACDITESLLSFSKQKGDHLELVQVENLVETVLRLIKTALENEGIEIVKNYNKVRKTLLNPGKIQQVFVNIMINARHAIERNGKVTIDISEKDGKWICVSFTDTGKGIEAENLGRIFEPFYTTKGSFGGGTQPGTGIGLSLCYNIIKQHNGDLTVASEMGKGSRFTVTLPIITKTPAKSEKESNEKLIAKVAPGQRTLIVEDTKDLRDLLKHVLEEKGFEVYLAENGGEAVEMCKKEYFDIMFLDIRMPGLKDGFQVFDEVKRLEPNTKIIIITGRAEDATLMKYVGYANGYLRKPFEIDDIYQVLQE